MDTIVPAQKPNIGKILLLIVLFLVAIGIPLGLFVLRSPTTSPPNQMPQGPFPTRSTFVTDTFTGDEYVRGWFWGPEKAVKGTPSTWEMTKVGDKFCWHLPIVMCKN